LELRGSCAEGAGGSCVHTNGSCAQKFDKKFQILKKIPRKFDFKSQILAAAFQKQQRKFDFKNQIFLAAAHEKAASNPERKQIKI